MLSPNQLTRMQATATRVLQTTPCTLSRGGGALGSTTCYVRPSTQSVHPIPGVASVGDLVWLIDLPAYTDVRTGDHIGALGTVYLVVQVKEPRTIEIQRQCVCYVLVAAGSTGPTLLCNATVTVTRQSGTAVATGRRVFLEWPTAADPIQPAGALVVGFLYDVPAVDAGSGPVYLLGDKVTITEEDGFPVVSHQASFTVGLVQHIADTMPLVRIHLSGANR